MRFKELRVLKMMGKMAYSCLYSGIKTMVNKAIYQEFS